MDEAVLRDQLIAQLGGGQAYPPVADLVHKFPVEQAGVRIASMRHTAWELLEHLRIAQWDILEFTLHPEHVTPPWPDEHWPTTAEPESDDGWLASVETFLAQLDRVKDLARDPKTPLFQKIPHGSGQTYLREILLVADHNAYHLGQLSMLRSALAAEAEKSRTQGGER